jgi:hypothetical protein
MSTQPDFTEIRNNPESFGIYAPDGGVESFEAYINNKLAGKRITSYQEFMKHVGNIARGVISTRNAYVFSNGVEYQKIYDALYPNNGEAPTEKHLKELSDDDKKKQMEKNKSNYNNVGGKRSRRNKKSRKTSSNKKSKKTRKTCRGRK